MRGSAIPPSPVTCAAQITSVELLPIHAAMDEPHLTRLGLTNYWGYSSMSFFAPDPVLATPPPSAPGPRRSWTR